MGSTLHASVSKCCSQGDTQGQRQGTEHEKQAYAAESVGRYRHGRLVVCNSDGLVFKLTYKPALYVASESRLTAIGRSAESMPSQVRLPRTHAVRPMWVLC